MFRDDIERKVGILLGQMKASSFVRVTNTTD